MEAIEIIKQAIECMNDDSGRARSYSGRGMYGRECLAITSSHETSRVLMFLLECCVQVINDEVPTEEIINKLFEVMDLINNPRADSMGRDNIIYWPSISADSIFTNDDDDTNELEEV